MAIGIFILTMVSYVLLKSSIKTATEAVYLVNEISEAPFGFIGKFLFTIFLDRDHQTKLKYNPSKTDHLIEESANVGKNLNKIKNSMVKHIDFIQKSIAVHTGSIYPSSSIQSDKNEINSAGRKLLTECRIVESLLYEGVAEQAIGSSRLDNLKRMSVETDFEFRVRLKNEVEKIRRRISRFLEVIRNTTIQTKVLQEESAGFCELLDTKKKSYEKKYEEATKPKSFLNYAKNLISAFCAGATAGATSGAMFSGGNPIVAGIVGGAGGTVAGTAQFVKEVYSYNRNIDIANESVDMVGAILTLQNGNTGLLLYTKMIEKTMKNINLELNEITFDIDNIESTTGHERFVDLILESYGKINDGYSHIFNENEIVETLENMRNNVLEPNIVDGITEGIKVPT